MKIEFSVQQVKAFMKRNLGIILGAIYALVLRLVFGLSMQVDIWNLFSITFVFVVPMVIGVIPLLYANEKDLARVSFRMGSPVWTVIVFFSICFITRIEDLICLWIILFPYIAIAMITGFVAGTIIYYFKNRNKTLHSIVLLPFLLAPIEQQFERPAKNYSVVTREIINADPETVWSNIVRVNEIKDEEYTKGVFNYAGIPRPLYAELDVDTLGATRIGHFEGGLQFLEKVTLWERNKQIAFDITVVPSTIRKTVFDEHVLKGKHFQFLNAAYTLEKTGDGQTLLLLSSSYALKTHFNGYASYFGNQLLTDFQERLLSVIKSRCEK